MKKYTSVIWGLVLVAVGVLLSLRSLNIVSFDIFFDGWWTLFILVPCTVGLFTERDKMGNVIGIAVGVFLLLCCQDVLDFSMLWKLLIPVIIVLVGFKMIFGQLFGNKAAAIFREMEQDGRSYKSGCATFSGTNLNFDGEVFEGAELTAVFGGVKCDLRNAVIEKDCAIKVSATFGGITILVPSGIQVKANTNSLFGGVDNKTPAVQNAPTLYVTGTCLFGGVEIK